MRSKNLEANFTRRSFRFSEDDRSNSMINREILKLLRERLGLSIPGLYATIGRKKRQIGYAFSTETAAYILAVENDIDISKHLKPGELAEVREAIRLTKRIQVDRSQTKVEKQVIVQLDKDFKIHCPNVPESVLKDARKMQRVYPYFYVFENSIRYFIKSTLENKYGKDWWSERVNPKIRDKASKRQFDEGRNRWHGKRGEHAIFYTNIDDLRKIIISNFDDFKNKLPDVKRPIEWLTNRIEEIELSRNVIAHHNPLSEDDITRVKMYLKEWVKQISDS